MTAKHIGVRMGVCSELEQYLEKKRLDSTENFLGKTTMELLMELGLFYEDLKVLTNQVCAYVAPKCYTLEQVHECQIESLSCLKTGIYILDKYLKGGIQCGTITEIVGPCGTGKTQLCHLIAVEALLDSQNHHENGKTVLYINSHNDFSSKRLVEIMSSLHPDKTSVFERCLEKIFILNFFDSQNFYYFLTDQLVQLMILRDTKLLIIDSMTAILKSEFDGASALSKQNFLYQIACKLKTVARKLNVAILVVNQSSDVFDKNKFSSTSSSLGMLWSHCVDTKILMSDHEGQFENVIKNSRIQSHDASSSNLVNSYQHVMTVEKSPTSPVLSFPYSISSGGIEPNKKSNSRLTEDLQQTEQQQMMDDYIMTFKPF